MMLIIGCANCDEILTYLETSCAKKRKVVKEDETDSDSSESIPKPVKKSRKKK